MNNDRILVTREARFALTLLFLFAIHWICLAQEKPAPQTQVVLLGTGTPLPDPERSGPCTAIVVNGTPYLVDLNTGELTTLPSPGAVVDPRINSAGTLVAFVHENSLFVVDLAKLEAGAVCVAARD